MEGRGRGFDFQIELGRWKIDHLNFDLVSIEPLTNFNEILIPKLSQAAPAFDHQISAEFYRELLFIKFFSSVLQTEF